MDAIRVSKVVPPSCKQIIETDPRSCQVQNVLFTKAGTSSSGTLHLTAHHIIFRYDFVEEKEMWVSVISLFQDVANVSATI